MACSCAVTGNPSFWMIRLRPAAAIANTVSAHRILNATIRASSLCRRTCTCAPPVGTALHVWRQCTPSARICFSQRASVRESATETSAHTDCPPVCWAQAPADPRVSRTFPDAKMSAVVLGSRIRMMTAANLRRSASRQRHGPSLQQRAQCFAAPLRVVFCVPCVEGDAFQVEWAAQGHSTHDILQLRGHASAF